MTRVVHVRKARFDYYIGREWAEFKASPFGNPFHLDGQMTRQECLLQFAEWWYAPEQKRLRNLALTLTGKVLGCWCAPRLCHGDIIAGYLDWKNYKEVQIVLDWKLVDR
jgi:hypothetical protein